MSFKPGRTGRGFTLTELAIVLGIFGAVLGSIWVAYGKMHFNRLVQQESNDLLAIATAVRGVYQGVPFTVGAFTDVTSTLVQENVFPSDLLYSGGYPLDREGGVIKVEQYSNAPSASATAFEIEFFGTTTTCNALAYQMSQMTGAMAPIYVYDNVHGWQSTPNSPTPNGNLTASSFAGCTYVSFAFNL